MSYENDQILKTIDSLYEAALRPHLWPAALDRVGDLFGQTALLLTMFDHSDNVLGRSFISRIDPHTLKLFHQVYNTPDTNPRLRRNHLLTVGQPVHGHQLCDDGTFFKSGVYADCYLPEGVGHDVAVILKKTKTTMAGVAFLGQARRGPFESEDIRLIEVLIPHFQRAVQVLSVTTDGG